MGCKQSYILSQEEILEIEKETGFKKDQISHLFTRFNILDIENKGYLSRSDFLNISELSINPLGERIIQAFLSHDQNGYGVDFSQFIKTLAIFRPIKEIESKKKNDDINILDINSRQSKLKFAFGMLDFGKDHYIHKDELKGTLHMMLGDSLSSEQLDLIVLRVMDESDYDRDGKLSFQDFEKALETIDVESKMSAKFV